MTKVIFNNVTLKNFLSFGNTPTSIDLSGSANTLVTAFNGAGKTCAYVDSIYFALYGTTYRSIKKTQIINSINKKQCVVELKFTKGGDAYTLTRGIAPDIFECRKNGVECIKGTVREKQAQLIDIVGMNSTVFTQTCLLAADYTPFMRLDAPHRRLFVETVLGLQIFTDMHETLKKRVKEAKAGVIDIDLEMTGVEKRLAVVNASLEANQNWLVDDYEGLSVKLKITTKRLNVLKDVEVLLKKRKANACKIKDAILDAKTGLNTKLNATRAQYDVISSGDCWTCGQPIEGAVEKKATVKADIDEQIEIMADFEMQKLTPINEKLVEINGLIAENAQEIQYCTKIYSGITQKLGGGDQDKLKELLDTLSEDRRLLVKELEDLTDKRADRAVELRSLIKVGNLFATNIAKNQIIREYMPYLNERINHYLAQMGFHVSFELDENFSETIRSRYRDTFSYENFSEGQKLRIDLALLFTWRDVAKKLHSVESNLLVMDEVLSGSADRDAVENFIRLIHSLEDTNSFVISHDDNLVGSMKHTVTFDVKNNFSIMVG